MSPGDDDTGDLTNWLAEESLSSSEEARQPLPDFDAAEKDASRTQPPPAAKEEDKGEEEDLGEPAEWLVEAEEGLAEPAEWLAEAEEGLAEPEEEQPEAEAPAAPAEGPPAPDAPAEDPDEGIATDSDPIIILPDPPGVHDSSADLLPLQVETPAVSLPKAPPRTSVFKKPLRLPPPAPGPSTEHVGTVAWIVDAAAALLVAGLLLTRGQNTGTTLAGVNAGIESRRQAILAAERLPAERDELARWKALGASIERDSALVAKFRGEPLDLRALLLGVARSKPDDLYVERVHVGRANGSPTWKLELDGVAIAGPAARDLVARLGGSGLLDALDSRTQARPELGTSVRVSATVRTGRR
jgi:hypothetical protein